MKTGNFGRVWNNIGKSWGRQFSFTLAVIMFTTFFLWSWENNPLVTSLLSAQEQFMRHTSEFLVDEYSDSPIIMKYGEHSSKEYSHLHKAEDKKEDSSMFVKPSEHSSKEYIHSQDAEDAIEDSPVFTERSELSSKEYSHSQEAEDTKVEDKTKDADYITVSPKEDDKISTSSFETEACNFARGRWVQDSRRPLYSGLGCKQWLSDMWACRLTQRTDFSYEGYRWHPENCEMPEFDRSEFLKKLRDKTIAFIGDSLGRQQFQSLMCMATGGLDNPEVEDVGRKYGLVKPRGAIRPDGWAFRFPNTNTTILYYWSASLCGIEPINPTDPATEYAMHLDRPPAFLDRFIDQFHVVVLNTGHHWNRGKVNANKWVMYVNGKPLKDRKLLEIGNAKNFTVFSIARWLDKQIPLHSELKAFFRTLSPRHFFHGEWNTGGSCDNTTPLTRGSEVRQEESSDPVIAGAVKGTKVKLLDITAISELRDEGHISHYSIKASEGINDCLHWCLPGIPDTWNELLYAQL